jgi:hypothetical protein
MCPDCGCGDSYDHHSWCPLKRQQEIQADKDKVRRLESELLRCEQERNDALSLKAFAVEERCALDAEKRAEALRELLRKYRPSHLSNCNVRTSLLDWRDELAGHVIKCTCGLQEALAADNAARKEGR